MHIRRLLHQSGKPDTNWVQKLQKNFLKTIDNHREWMYNYARSNDY